MKHALLDLATLASFAASAGPALATDYELGTNRGGMHLRLSHCGEFSGVAWLGSLR